MPTSFISSWREALSIAAILGVGLILSIWSHVVWISEDGNGRDSSTSWWDSKVFLK